MNLDGMNKSELVKLTTKLRKKNKELEKASESTISNLNERVKELSCLHNISKILDDRSLSLMEVLQKIIDILPEAFRYPEATYVDMEIEGAKFTTEAFKKSKHSIKSKIVYRSKILGKIEIFVNEDELPYKEGPFLEEEKRLLNTIAGRIGRVYSLYVIEQAWELDKLNLAERVKELNCLYAISRILENKEIGIQETLQEIVDVIPLSWQYPKHSHAKLEIEGMTFTSKNFKNSKRKLISVIRINKVDIGYIEVHCNKKPCKDAGDVFLDEERDLISNIASKIGVVFEIKLYEEKLFEQVKKTEDANLALRTVLAQIEKDKLSFRENVAINVEKNVKPLLYDIKKAKSVSEDTVDHIMYQLDNLTSDFYKKMVKFKFNLTPTETKIAQMVRSGYQIKEIAGANSISIATVKAHTKNIRKKLGLTNKPITLKTYFNEIEL
jgi:DNA-binding CsgD family transcriptional regulator